MQLLAIEFQAIQEATIGYHQDPVLMMANPLAAEGVTAISQSMSAIARSTSEIDVSAQKVREASRSIA